MAALSDRLGGWHGAQFERLRKLYDAGPVADELEGKISGGPGAR